MIGESDYRARSNLGFYCPGGGTGGPWRYVHSIVAGLDTSEFDATLLCDIVGEYGPRPGVRVIRLGGPPAYDGGAAMRPAGEAMAVAAGAANGNSGRRAWVPGAARLWAGFAREARRLGRVIAGHRFDLLHTQNTGCEESPVAARLASAGRVLGTFHVDSTYDLAGERSGLGHRVLEHVSNFCLHRAIAVSEATRRDWLRRTHLPPERVVTIHNGIDPAKFGRRRAREEARQALGLPLDALVVGGVGRLDEAKGFAYLIRAVAELAGRYPKLVLVLAGEGSLRGALDTEAARLGIADRVRLVGFQRDVQIVLDALDAYVMSSLAETLGYALLEAMATELPTVGTTVGGIPEVIVEGQTGFLARPRDPAGLAAALRPLLDSADLRSRLGAAGRDRVVRHFNEADMVRKTIAVYREMLKGVRPQARGGR